MASRVPTGVNAASIGVRIAASFRISISGTVPHRA
jgi:hypothetical protein